MKITLPTVFNFCALLAAKSAQIDCDFIGINNNNKVNVD